jgi:hypothetical protein
MRKRGEDQLVENEQLLGLAFQTLFCLLRIPIILKPDSLTVLETDKILQRMSQLIKGSQYLSDEEKEAGNKMTEFLYNFYSILRKQNHKSEIINNLLQTSPNLSIISHHTRYIKELETEFRTSENTILCDRNFRDLQNIKGAIIPGWFGHDRMSRILTPPATNPLHLVLYGIEYQWYSQYQEQLIEARIQRAAQNPRSNIFPNVKGWNIPPNVDSPNNHTIPKPSYPNLDDIQKYILSYTRKYAYRSVLSDGSETVIPARLFLFDGGLHAFLRDSYRAIVVTHLLDEPNLSTEEEVDVERKTASELEGNDALLFHRRSNRDVIRITADKELPTGIREIAALWRKALVNYSRQSGLDPEGIWRLLKEKGCPLHPVTIRIWLEDEEMIGPRNYARDIPIILKVTCDNELAEHMQEVLDAIRIVFGAHQRASHMIARQVQGNALKLLQDVHGRANIIEMDPDIILTRILEIDNLKTPVRLSMVNRLLDSEVWQE